MPGLGLGCIAWACVDLFLCIVLEVGYSYAKEISMHAIDHPFKLYFSFIFWLSWSVREVCCGDDE